MKKVFIITISIICSLFFFGCSKDDNTLGKKEEIESSKKEDDTSEKIKESELFNVRYEISVDDPTFF